jgi:spoIIIJ-associated protein
VAFDAADDTFETSAPGAAAERGGREDRDERGGRGGRGRRGGRGGRGGRGRGGERGERPARELDDQREAPDTAGADEFVVSGSPELEPAVPREHAREQRSRRDQHAGEVAAPVDGHEPAPAVESEVIESAVVANVAPKTKPRAWGGLGARRAKPAVGPALPRVEQESPATAGSVYKPPRTKQTRPVVERPAAAAQIGEIEAPSAGGYGAPRGGSYGGARAADEVIAAGIAATDYAKALAPVDEAGQPALLTELTNGMLARAGFPCECETIPGEYHAVKVSVDEDGAGMLIGRGGQTAEAVEHLVERMASNAAGDRVRMNLDINDYRVRREGSLRERTLEIIADVRATGEPYHMEPMDARERRVVHLTAEEQPDITTYTVVGSGGKHVVIARADDQVPGAGDGADED